MSDKKTPNNDKDNPVTKRDDAGIVRRIAAFIIIAFILIFIICGISGLWYIKSALEPVDPESDKDVSVDIPLGSSTSDIASLLEEKGIIKNSTIFRFYLKFKNESEFQAGDYTLSPSMEIDELVKVLKKGKVLKEPMYSVTIPEGKTIKEMASIYAAALPFSKEAFLNKVNDPHYMDNLINTHPDILSNAILDPQIRTPLEGYLFAATYNFYSKEPGVEKVVSKMLEKTAKVVKPRLDDIASRDLTVHKALTMASIVQKEARSKKQRRKIAGVFYNRLEKDMPLQTDPTVLYALGEHKEKVLLEDLEVESPYNTYHVDTLPAGPIANFSKTSFNAAINPENTDYIYFLHDDKGNIHYAKTRKKHKQLKAQYID
ncbi:endolytic transglycosylase MltG [Lentibacillus halophilus]|uniref:Endolytic murein transglycosylase n=1 Tax=Lentibacillus halophilus TaxID=295065 RepID=A0ABP3J898_9BACI